MKDVGVAKVLVVGATVVDSINAELEAAGQGPDFFSVPLCDKNLQNDKVTHFACSVSMTRAHELSIVAILLRYGVINSPKDFYEVLNENHIRKPIKKVKEGFDKNDKKDK